MMLILLGYSKNRQKKKSNTALISCDIATKKSEEMITMVITSYSCIISITIVILRNKKNVHINRNMGFGEDYHTYFNLVR